MLRFNQELMNPVHFGLQAVLVVEVLFILDYGSIFIRSRFMELHRVGGYTYSMSSRSRVFLNFSFGLRVG